MAQRFCTKCGAPVGKSSQKFCTKCGSPLTQDPQHPGVQPAPEAEANAAGTQPKGPGTHAPATATVADTSGVDRMAGDMGAYAPPEPQTVAMPVLPNTPPATADPAARPQSFVASAPPAPPARESSRTSVTVAIVAAVIIVAAAIVVAVLHPWDGGSAPSSSATQPQTESSAASSGSASAASPAAPASSSASSGASTADDARIYATLADAYDKMGGYNARIADVAGVFNNTYTSSSMSERQANANTAKALRDEISSGLNTLKGLSVPASSKYSQVYGSICQLQQDLFNRIDVICQSWENSLRYSNPKDHASEILAPIAKDNDSAGVNIYKKDFDALYPNARPVE